MSLALLFPGQGVQHAGMLPWLEAEPLATPVLAAMAATLGPDWRAQLGDDAWAGRNRVAQTLITGVSLAAWSALAPRLPPPVLVAGYSVGELAAYGAAGVFHSLGALALARQRATAMDRCAIGAAQGLMAVSGASASSVESLCSRYGLTIAIRIGIERCLLGGTLDALHSAAQTLASRGVETTFPRVGLASHTPLMAPAARAFAQFVDSQSWQRGASLIVNGVDGVGRRDVEPLKQALIDQIDHTVQWDRCMETVAERHPRCVLEVGPGTSLTRMWASNGQAIPARSVDEFRSAAAVVEWVRSALA